MHYPLPAVHSMSHVQMMAKRIHKLISVVYLVYTIDHVHVNTPKITLSLHELLLLEYYN